MTPRRRGNQDIDVDREIENLWRQGFGAASIHKELVRSGKFVGRTPQVRTIRRRITQFAEDTSGGWQMSEASGEEAASVLPYIAHIADMSSGRITRVTNCEAKWVVRLRQVFPEMGPVVFSDVVREYNRRELEKADTTTLDLLLGFAPWYSDTEEDAFRDEKAFFKVLDHMYRDVLAPERQRMVAMGEIVRKDWDEQRSKLRNKKEENDGGKRKKGPRSKAG